MLSLQLLLSCYIRLLWVEGLTAVLLVQFRWEIAVMPAVTAVMLLQFAMELGTASNYVSTGVVSL